MSGQQAAQRVMEGFGSTLVSWTRLPKNFRGTYVAFLSPLSLACWTWKKKAGVANAPDTLSSHQGPEGPGSFSPPAELPLTPEDPAPT